MQIRGVLLNGLLALSLPVITKENKVEQQCAEFVERLSVLESEYKEAIDASKKDNEEFERELAVIIKAKNSSATYYLNKLSSDIKKAGANVSKCTDAETKVGFKTFKDNLNALSKKIKSSQFYKSEKKTKYKTMAKVGCIATGVYVAFSLIFGFCMTAVAVSIGLF